MNALLEYEQYMPHGMCLLWEPWLVLLWSGSDALIFAAYMAIPLAIIMVLKRRPDLNHRGLVTLFAAFILLCGITHGLSIVTLWYPIYPQMGVIKLATGVVSVVTAAALFRLIPTLIRIPTPDEHEDVIAQLERTLADLSLARDELEDRVKTRTQELKEANTRLSFTARDAVQRSRNLIQVVSALTQPGVDFGHHHDLFLRDLRGRINSLAIATSTVMEQNESAWASIERVVRRQVEPFFAKPDTKLLVSGPAVEVGAQGAQQISLVAWELASRFAKMGRWDQAAGRIEAKWWVTHASEPQPGDMLDESADGAGDTFTFEWREILKPSDDAGVERYVNSMGGDDEECGIVTPKPLENFSDALLTRVVPRLLDGNGRIDVEQSTFIYTLTCPLSAVIDSRDLKISKGPIDKLDLGAIGGR